MSLHEVLINESEIAQYMYCTHFFANCEVHFKQPSSPCTRRKSSKRHLQKVITFYCKTLRIPYVERRYAMLKDFRCRCKTLHHVVRCYAILGDKKKSAKLFWGANTDPEFTGCRHFGCKSCLDGNIVLLVFTIFQAVALDPDFSKKGSKQFVTGSDKVQFIVTTS